MPSVHVQLLEKFQALFLVVYLSTRPKPFNRYFFSLLTQENILYNICCVWGGMEALRKLHAHLAIFITCAPVDLE